MADLFIELWHLVFEHLELVDLSTCALISKKMYFAVNTYPVRALAFTGRTEGWFHTIFATHKHRVDFAMTSILNRSPFSFELLKRLKIGRESPIDLNEINRFTLLEELDIDLKNYRNEANRTLSLANLKTLHVFMSEHISLLELQTPKLANVNTFDLKKLQFAYPHSVEAICTFFHGEKLMANLRRLYFADFYGHLDYDDKIDTRKIPDFSNLSLNLVKELKKLKELAFHFNNMNFVKRNLGNFQKIIRDILALGLPDLKLFWMGVQVTDADLLNEFSPRENIMIFQLRHFKKKIYCTSLSSFYFNDQVKFYSTAGIDVKSNEFLRIFFAKFSPRELIVSGKVVEQELLINFILRSRSLFKLKFSKSGLKQTFFDRLAKIIRLNRIPLRELRFEKSEPDLKFDFVCEIRQLQLFESDAELPTETFAKLVQLPCLTELKCLTGKQQVELKSTCRYSLDGNSLSLQELMKHLESNENKSNSKNEA